jgi:plastocyanin
MRGLSTVIAVILTGTWAFAGSSQPRQATTTETGAIRGRVVLPLAPVTTSPRPMVGSLAGTPHEVPDRRRAVVYIDPAPQPALEELPAGRARMDQRNEEFIPHVLAVTVGTVVDFPNDDTKFHNVFSLSHVKPFDLGRYPAGHSKSVTFDKSGIVPISCDIHTHMSAWVLVFNHPYFAVADEDGRYTIGGVPTGSYTLKVWSESGQADARAIVVGAGQTVDCDFHLDRAR